MFGIKYKQPLEMMSSQKKISHHSNQNVVTFWNALINIDKYLLLLLLLVVVVVVVVVVVSVIYYLFSLYTIIFIFFFFFFCKCSYITWTAMLLDLEGQFPIVLALLRVYMGIALWFKLVSKAIS